MCLPGPWEERLGGSEGQRGWKGLLSVMWQLNTVVWSPGPDCLSGIGREGTAASRGCSGKGSGFSVTCPYTTTTACHMGEGIGSLYLPTLSQESLLIVKNY